MESMYTNIDIRYGIRIGSKVIVSSLIILRLDTRLGVTFSTYVGILIVRYKSYAPQAKYIHWERFVRAIHFGASTESSCFTTHCSKLGPKTYVS
jgi:hypothetical protein